MSSSALIGRGAGLSLLPRGQGHRRRSVAAVPSSLSPTTKGPRMSDETVDLACPVCSRFEQGRPGSRCTAGGHFPPVPMHAITPERRSAIEARKLARREAGDRVLPNLIAEGGVAITDDRGL